MGFLVSAIAWVAESWFGKLVMSALFTKLADLVKARAELAAHDAAIEKQAREDQAKMDAAQSAEEIANAAKDLLNHT